jgi:hypothetical protein
VVLHLPYSLSLIEVDWKSMMGGVSARARRGGGGVMKLSALW